MIMKILINTNTLAFLGTKIKQYRGIIENIFICLFFIKLLMKYVVQTLFN
jgi:hypothetical protein